MGDIHTKFQGWLKQKKAMKYDHSTEPRTKQSEQ